MVRKVPSRGGRGTRPNPTGRFASATPPRLERILADMIPQIRPEEVKARLDAGERMLLLDVRNPDEFAYCHLEGAMLIPLPELPSRLEEIEPTGAPIVVYCHHGIRSLSGAAILRAAGYDALNLTGGIDLWSRTVDPTLPRY